MKKMTLREAIPTRSITVTHDYDGWYRIRSQWEHGANAMYVQKDGPFRTKCEAMGGGA